MRNVAVSHVVGQRGGDEVIDYLVIEEGNNSNLVAGTDCLEISKFWRFWKNDNMEF